MWHRGREEGFVDGESNGARGESPDGTNLAPHRLHGLSENAETSTAPPTRS
jgi:hypothetical protein